MIFSNRKPHRVLQHIESSSLVCIATSTIKMFRATTAALVGVAELVGVAAGNECMAENFNLVSQSNEGTVTTSVAGIKIA